MAQQPTRGNEQHKSISIEIPVAKPK